MRLAPTQAMQERSVEESSYPTHAMGTKTETECTRTFGLETVQLVVDVLCSTAGGFGGFVAVNLMGYRLHSAVTYANIGS